MFFKFSNARSLSVHTTYSRYALTLWSQIDRNNRAWYAMKACERWLSVRLELLGAFVVLLAALLAVVSVNEGTLKAGLAGFSINFAMSITGLLNWTVRMRAELVRLTLMPWADPSTIMC